MRSVSVRHLLGTPLRWWWHSLPLRVIASTLIASIVVLWLGGLLLMQQATSGVLEGKKNSSVAESRAVLDTSQRRLDAADITGANVNETLTQLAIEIANRGTVGGQYQVFLQGSVSATRSGGVLRASVPQSLQRTVEEGEEQIWVTPTLVQYSDGRPPEPGFAVGSRLVAPGSGTYPIYFIFPLTQEMQVLEVLQNAVLITGALLVILLAVIAALVSRTVVSPVRAARLAAERLADGLLDDRMEVKGTDDLARLAISMNHMASELQKQIQQLEELSRVQQRFVSDVSHELRTPLTTVRMAAEVLHESREDFDPIAARSAELLQDELDRFEALLTDLLEISRFDAGAAVLTVEDLDLRDLVHRVVAANASLAARLGVEVTVHAENEAQVQIDARRVERILRNLVVNALEHSEGRPIDVFVASDDQAVAVAVRDHGVGFEANQAKMVFHRFWRADPARARTIGGTGLGLSISMEDARLHGGWLNAWGRPGMGAQFRLTLPRRAGAVLEQSPLPVVPRDLVGPSMRRGGMARPLNPPPEPARDAAEPDVAEPAATKVLIVDRMHPDERPADEETVDEGVVDERAADGAGNGDAESGTDGDVTTSVDTGSDEDAATADDAAAREEDR